MEQVEQADPKAEAEAEEMAHHMAVLNEVMRRVQVVMGSFTETLARGRPGMTLTGNEVHAILNGAASAIAAYVAALSIKGEPADAGDQRSPDEVLADMIRDQFINVVVEQRAMRERVQTGQEHVS